MSSLKERMLEELRAKGIDVEDTQEFLVIEEDGITQSSTTMITDPEGVLERKLVGFEGSLSINYLTVVDPSSPLSASIFIPEDGKELRVNLASELFQRVKIDGEEAVVIANGTGNVLNTCVCLRERELLLLAFGIKVPMVLRRAIERANELLLTLDTVPYPMERVLKDHKLFDSAINHSSIDEAMENLEELPSEPNSVNVGRFNNQKLAVLKQIEFLLEYEGTKLLNLITGHTPSEQLLNAIEACEEMLKTRSMICFD